MGVPGADDGVDLGLRKGMRDAIVTEVGVHGDNAHAVLEASIGGNEPFGPGLRVATKNLRRLWGRAADTGSMIL